MKLGTLVYIVRDGKTLMLFRNKKINDCHEGLWVAPGGKVDMHLNESPEACAIREVYEETGLTLKSLKLSGFITFPDLGNSPFGDLWYVWLFKSDDFSGETIDSPEGELRWIDNAQIVNLPMWEGDKIFTPLIFQDKIFSGVFTYDKESFLGYNITYL